MRFRLKSPLLLSLSVLTLFMNACADSQESTTHGFPNEAYIWDTLSVPVCWENPESRPAEERQWVRDAMRDSWERWSKLRLTGWGTCSANSRDGIRIVLEDAWPRALGLGKTLRGKDKGVLLNHTFQNWGQTCAASEQARKACIISIAVHEFGHALGFAHEHNRDDRPAECTKERQGTDGTNKIGHWDLNSVMNYCSPIYNNNGQLSKIDIMTLQYYYGRPQETLQSFVQPISEGNNIWSSWKIELDAPADAVVDEQFKVLVDLDHPNLSELSLTLQAPDGTYVSLHNRGPGSDGIHGAYPDTRTPHESLQKILGKKLRGTWTLWAYDAQVGQSGRLNRFGIADYLPEAYLMNFTATLNPLDANRFNAGNDEVVFEQKFVATERFPIQVSPNELAERLRLTTDAGQPVPFRAAFQNNSVIVMVSRKDLFAETSYALTLSRGRLHGSYSVDKDYTLTFRTPREATAPDSGIIGGTQSLNLPIPDANPSGISGQITIDAAPEFVVTSGFKVHLQLKHPYSGDLRISLISPTGVEVLLHNKTGSSDKGFDGYFPSNYTPVESFSKLHGQKLSGTWTLRIIDFDSGDKGSLLKWSLENSLMQ